MKIGSYNIRGLGSVIKKEDIFSFFTNNKLDFCCIQEMNIENFTEFVGRSIWKTSAVKWCAEGSRGRAGGLLAFWDERNFSSSSYWSLGGAVVVNGRRCSTEEEYCIINVYAPCILEEKLLLFGTDYPW